MNKNRLVILILFSIVLLSSCAIHQGYMNTSASLSQPNFIYVKKGVKGTSSATYFLGGIGGLSRQAIVEEAKQDMVQKYPLKAQKDILDETFTKWKGRQRQVDDVLVIGIKI